MGYDNDQNKHNTSMVFAVLYECYLAKCRDNLILLVV